MDDRADARDRLVDRLQRSGPIRSSRVADAVRTVPRHVFVPEDERDRAYEDAPLPIGHEQEITAPHLVGRMADLLDLEPGTSVLEIGAGSGYHAAVVAELVGADHVVTVERVPDLARLARRNLDRAGYDDVALLVGDGSRGLPGGAPYDRINVTCAAPEIPEPLLDQLANGGRMTVPLGDAPRGSHTLYLVEKGDDGVDRTSHGGVRFVPLVGAHGFSTAD
ncbi:protein-L-isoaspartate(D-aspartate) O-methyltransferase [Halosolutus halophilus]|uniref:protein-L-isoaspartate(D-aspartate) O-methyltransferase n=1 Tax=Halosolutus halophilus TaxID=1552990 RepID=UPI002234F4D5|nr:protein-L-isoaspartate(D-aspartate) O-methyltransferase [Halosolutus halophilus]